jgi:hypothetical protein
MTPPAGTLDSGMGWHEAPGTCFSGKQGLGLFLGIPRFSLPGERLRITGLKGRIFIQLVAV